MFDISAPYRSEDRVPFAWDADLIVERAFAARNILPSRNGMGLASTRAVNDPRSLLMLDDGSLRPAAGLIRPGIGSPALERQGLAAFELLGPQWATAATERSNLGLFRRELLRFEVEKVERFLTVLLEFAGGRKFGEQKMLNIVSIRLRFAEIRQKCTFLSELINENDAFLGEIRNTANDLCTLLIRVAGGRSLLAGGLVEMKLVINLANRIYL